MRQAQLFLVMGMGQTLAAFLPRLEIATGLTLLKPQVHLRAEGVIVVQRQDDPRLRPARFQLQNLRRQAFEIVEMYNVIRSGGFDKIEKAVLCCFVRNLRIAAKRKMRRRQNRRIDDFIATRAVPSGTMAGLLPPRRTFAQIIGNPCGEKDSLNVVLLIQLTQNVALILGDTAPRFSSSR